MGGRNWTAGGIASNFSLDLFDDDDYFTNFTDFNDAEIGRALRAAHNADGETFRAFIAMLVVSIALFGLVINIFITFVSLVNIHGDYRHFIANLAIVDIACALLYAFMGYINLSDRNQFSTAVMTYSAFAFYGSFGILICALVPVSISRVIAASQPKIYDQFFSGHRALLICLAADTFPLLLLTVICVARHDVAKWLFFFYAGSTVLAHLITFASNFMVFRMVARHIRVVQCLHDRTRLLETRQVAWATLLQAVIPLVCQVPAFLFLSSALLLVEPITHGNVIVLTQLSLAASPLLDGLISLFVIKQYRIQVIAFFGAFFNTHCCSSAYQKPSVIVEQHNLSCYSSIPPLSCLMLFWLLYLLFFIVTFVFLLSGTGRSTGLRVFCAKLLIHVFEWVSQLEEEERYEEDERQRDQVHDDLEDVGSGGTEREEKRAGAAQRRRRNRPSALIQRHWTAIIDRKLHASDVETDTEDPNAPVEVPRVRGHTVNTIVQDAVEFVMSGVEAIIEDEVTSRFKASQLPSWNLLTRSRTYAHVDWRISVVWFFGLLFRYGVLFPVRLTLFTVGILQLIVCSLVIGLVKNDKLRSDLNRLSMFVFMRTMGTAASAIIRFHDTHNRPKHGVAVSNHSSPIDVMILSCDQNYAMIGQRHGGILGLMQSALERCSHHIFFERSEARDRNLVRQALQDHVKDPTKLPVLIFPEGTCINNTAVLQFKKGSFEVSDVVHPIALVYDNRLGDAFWDSSEQGYFGYLLSIMSSWALIADVYYLPPMYRQEGEDAASFACRVKRSIAKRGGLVDLEWDGNLKRSIVPEKLKDERKARFYQHLLRTTTICDYPPEVIETIRQLSTTTIDDLPEVFDDDDDRPPSDEQLAEEHEEGLQQRRRIRDEIALVFLNIYGLLHHQLCFLHSNGVPLKTSMSNSPAISSILSVC
ncbi:Phospholipid/glycerol acyltransferase domain-containing protein [Aphelenchoides fujianensis]|nr:Phospholipid/glycerol acyltransferase domain-containing protein [Aphelenchoides fujianensis]